MNFFMATQFWVNNYFIDVSRNQIKHQQQATQIPPKALKVLEVLASRAGEVVSHDELMDVVWESSVVGPNTLQRAIAQLRKAFGDDSKQQAFIKTHAKKGYSLEANVRWETNNNQKTPVRELEPNKSLTYRYALAALASVALLVFMLFPSEQAVFDRVMPLTASDEQEFNAAYSPDGRYLVFNRYVGQCISHLWAKDLTNNQEERLSTEPGHYSQLSWSSDGSQLAFILQSDCSDDLEYTQQCWQLQTLDFAEAWNGNAKNLLRYNCANIKTTHPTWLNDGRIAMLQYPTPDSNQPTLVIYDAVADELTNIPTSDSDRIYSLDYSRRLDRLATVSISDDHMHILRTLSVDGTTKSEAQISPTESYSADARFPIDFSPDGEHFLTHLEGQIYRLGIDGDLTLMHPASHSGLWNPSYHPSQEKFAATFGIKDYDIGYLSLESEEEADIQTFARSTSVDFNAKFQPSGELITFISHRSGKRQLWVIDGTSTYQLTQFEQGLRSSRYEWSPDGQTLAVNVNNQIALISLDGSYRLVKSPISVSVIMPWTAPDTLLVTDNQTKQQRLFAIDINSGDATDLAQEQILWAAYYQADQLLYLNSQGQAMLRSGSDSGSGSVSNIQPLNILTNKLFDDYLLLKGDSLYGISSQAKLWRYDLKLHQLTPIANLDKDVLYVTDIRDDKMLASKFIGGRRELVEFSQPK
ncbi:hypothetical protein DXX92_18545 [Thalassotalea euphylliae]|uniref:OmpR/PhoB-type domain-containing protein n=2 Tax=Thalassotalea euphylliae TaxID=1655234 RepID=A0A3E0UJR2_9GAMM|nr:hypothetical protein DXX92_18545 [Thalassotalea euphylliae]